MSLGNTIRLATGDDLAAMQRLIADDAASALDLRSTTSDGGHRYVLVLDDDRGGLAAAAIVALGESEATLELLAVDPAHRETGIEKRLLGVAEALCEAFGCERLVVPTATQVTDARQRRAATAGS